MTSDEAWHDRAAALAKLRTHRTRIADADVYDVLTRVRARGLDSLIEPWLTAERGRPATISGAAVMVGMFLTAREFAGKVQLVHVTDVLYFRISPRMRELLGIATRPDTAKSFEAAYAVVRHAGAGSVIARTRSC